MVSAPSATTCAAAAAAVCSVQRTSYAVTSLATVRCGALLLLRELLVMDRCHGKQQHISQAAAHTE